MLALTNLRRLKLDSGVMKDVFGIFSKSSSLYSNGDLHVQFTLIPFKYRSACYKTQPNELLNPANMLTCEPNFPSGYKNSGLVAPVASLRGNRPPTPDDNLPTASQKMKLFDEANGNHGELSHKSIFQTEDTDCSFTDAESEGMTWNTNLA